MVKNLPYPGFDPQVGKIPWRRKWLPLQYSCLGNPMDRRAWWVTVHRVTRVSNFSLHGIMHGKVSVQNHTKMISNSSERVTV